MGLLRPRRVPAALVAALALSICSEGIGATAVNAGPQLLCTAPTARLAMHPGSGQAPLAVVADASASTPGTCPIGSYAFSWGDGTSTGTQSGATAPHTYNSVGTYTVTVTVTDNELLLPASSTATATVTVVPIVIGPTAALSVTPPAGRAPLSVQASAAGSKAGTFPIAWYDFAWGDGSSTGQQPGSGAGHVYPNPGSYTVTVTVGDNQAPAHTSTAQFTVNVGVGVGPTPSLVLNPPSGPTPLTITADASGSAPGSSPIATYDFDFGDGTRTGPHPASGVQHTYPNPGTYTVTVTVVDKAGVSASTTAKVTAGSAPGTLVHRVAGPDRIATGIAVSQLRWSATGDTSPGARHPGAVVLARGDDFADALAGIPLAVKANGPLLLSDTGALNASVDAEIRRILPSGGRVYLLGGNAALSPAVEAKLKQNGYVTTRLAGVDRFGTSLAIAKNGLGDPAHILVATGDDFPDALAAGPYAASAFAVNGQPAAIVLTDDRKVPAAVAAYMKSKAVGSTNANPNIVAIGGPGAWATAGIMPNSQFDALVGADRFDTAARVAPYFPISAPIGLASGVQFPDALTGGTLMAEIGGPVLLTEPSFLDVPTARALGTAKGATALVEVFGGPAAISDATVGRVAQAVGGHIG